MMPLIQNIAIGLLYIVGIPIIGACGVAVLYWLNGQKSKLNFRLRKKPTGETAWRDIRPDRISFENNEWHHDSQWILYAFDYSRNADRGFAIKDIQEWKTP